MYGIFTYITGWFLGHMLVNIPYMEHLGICYKCFFFKPANMRLCLQRIPGSTSANESHAGGSPDWNGSLLPNKIKQNQDPFKSGTSFSNDMDQHVYFIIIIWLISQKATGVWTHNQEHPIKHDWSCWEDPWLSMTTVRALPMSVAWALKQLTYWWQL